MTSAPQHQKNSPLVLVNEHDEVIGYEDKMTAHQQGILHRAFSVMLYRTCAQGTEILLQQRAQSKYHCPGLWSNTCCSHPFPNEATQDAAIRRLDEELNIHTALTLQHLGHFIYKTPCDNNLIEHELDHVYSGVYSDTLPQFNAKEVQAIKWMSLDDYAKDLTQNPHLYTPWSTPLLKHLNTQQWF